jgi:PTH1 family peptidyl-tRNA hydrolase
VKFVVGLGNPGIKYQSTRHNLGFLVVDRLAKQYNIAVDRELCDALVGEGLCNGEKIAIVKPQTFMNRSGSALKGFLHEYGGTASDLVIVYDDLDLPFGRIRIRLQGSAGGHRGILSIMESLAGARFCRLRVGIGRPPEGKDTVDYVLEPFSADEISHLSEIIDRAVASVDSLLRDGAQRAMEVFNRAQ